MFLIKLTAVCLLLTALKPVHTSGIQQNSSTQVHAKQCPLWQQKSATGNCTCSFDLWNTVVCQEHPYTLELLNCYCMTNKSDESSIVVGACQYTCQWVTYVYMYYHPIYTSQPDDLNEVMCSSYKRQGQMCGSCMDGYAPPVYSYSLSCVNCTTSNWAKYTAVSLLPVTAFFIFVITFRLSATSPILNGFILCIQLIFSPNNMRLDADETSKLYLTSMYGIWNLDFFRLVYTPFCLHPHTNTLQVLALDYIIAVYPLLLIALSYLLVLLYDRNVHFIVCLWKPFVPLFIRFRRQWNIRSSLVDAFATFLLLSYVKILSVSVDLLMPVVLYDQKGHTLPQLYLFNQGDVAFMGSHHLPYACLALFFLLTFTLVPMLLLFLYPCSCFQVCLNRTGCSCQPLHTFMDIFQGHYKNGTNGTRDLRFFSGLYLLLRGVVYASTVVAFQISSYAYTTVVITTLAVSVALAQPYKKQKYNIIDTILLTTTALLYVTLVPLISLKPIRLQRGLSVANYILGAIIILYLPTVCTVGISKFVYNRLRQKPMESGFERLLPK